MAPQTRIALALRSSRGLAPLVAFSSPGWSGRLPLGAALALAEDDAIALAQLRREDPSALLLRLDAAGRVRVERQPEAA